MKEESKQDIDVPKSWSFNTFDEPDSFKKHVQHQLPWYDLASELCAAISTNFITEGGRIYDLGAANGNIESKVNDIVKARSAKFHPVEVNPIMAKNYEGDHDITVCDACDIQFKEGTDCIISYLTLMFNKPEDRQRLLKNAYDGLRSGGSLIVVEKFLPSQGGHEGMITKKITLLQKMSAGVSAPDILSKELSLSGIQQPMHLEEFSVFANSETINFFRVGEFIGLVFVKPLI